MDPGRGARQWQGLRLILDGFAFHPRETSPRLDRHVRICAPPRPDELTAHEDAARPDARGPERTTTIGLGDQQLTIRCLKKEVRVAAREKPHPDNGPGSGAKRRLVG